jgi:hypothetical protein
MVINAEISYILPTCLVPSCLPLTIPQLTLSRPPDFIPLDKVQDMLSKGLDPMAVAQAAAEKAGDVSRA